MRNANRSLGRAKPSRAPLRCFFLVCEGKNTEPEYFKALVGRYRSAALEIKVIPKAGDPSAIVKVARGIRNGRSREHFFSDGDEVWAVFDCDTHHHYEAAKSECEKSGIECCYSDPCFELWIILYYEFFDQPIDHTSVQNHLMSLDKKYDKKGAKVCDISYVMGKIEEAEVRAARQLKFREDQGRPGGRPSTTVHFLTKRLRGIS